MTLLRRMLVSVVILFLPVYLLAAPKPGDFYASGRTKEKKIALTFDDGPGPNTMKFLDLLDKYQVKATFFVLGDQVNLKPKVAKEIVKRGHELGSHTMHHLNYKARSKKLIKENPLKGISMAKAELIADMRASREVIEKTTGAKLTILRMPHGVDSFWIHGAAKEAGFVLVNWTYGWDWNKGTAQEMIPDYVKAIQPGAIILLHDGWPKSDKSLEITEGMLKAIKEKGYEVVPVEKLIGF